jgi:hypothetical protein
MSVISWFRTQNGENSAVFAVGVLRPPAIAVAAGVCDWTPAIVGADDEELKSPLMLDATTTASASPRAPDSATTSKSIGDAAVLSSVSGTVLALAPRGKFTCCAASANVVRHSRHFI